MNAALSNLYIANYLLGLAQVVILGLIAYELHRLNRRGK